MERGREGERKRGRERGVQLKRELGSCRELRCLAERSSVWQQVSSTRGGPGRECAETAPSSGPGGDGEIRPLSAATCSTRPTGFSSV